MLAGAKSEDEITAEVLDRVASAPDPRVREISRSVVEHLHAIVRELRLTHAEWETAIDFLTRVGAKCDGKRQEFILLSDALGVSMLVDAVNGGGDVAATESTVLGPFYVADAPEAARGSDIADGMGGPALFISGSVRGPGEQPIEAALVDVWQADMDGFYDVQRPDAGMRGRARLRTDADGRFHLWTRMPAAYPIPDDGPVGEMLAAQGRHPYRPAHIHFRVEAASHRTLVTHLFAEGDAYIGSDAVFAVKPSLIRRFERRAPGIAPDGVAQSDEWFELAHDFRLTLVRASPPQLSALA